MKLVMTLLARNEEDIIRENIEYHLARGVDLIIATNNLSVDGTADILMEYESRGLLHYIFEAEDTHNQQVWVTRMAHMACSDFGADWVINNDADEFWWPLHGDLKEAFNSVQTKVCMLRANRHNFVPTGSPPIPFFSRMIYRTKVSLNSMGNRLPPKIAHRASTKVQVAPGNHSVSGFDSLEVAENLIEIFHFPIRTYDQFENKIAKGGAALKRNTEVSENVGSTWRKLHDRLQQDSNLQSFFLQNYHDDEQIKRELETGDLVLDTRLSEFMKTVIYPNRRLF